MDFWTSSVRVMLMIIVCWLRSASKIRVKIVIVSVHYFGFTANPSPPFRPKRLTLSGKLSVHQIYLQTDQTWICKHTFFSVTRLIIADHLGSVITNKWIDLHKPRENGCWKWKLASEKTTKSQHKSNLGNAGERLQKGSQWSQMLTS